MWGPRTSAEHLKAADRKAPHGSGSVLPDTLSTMHNPHLLWIRKMRKGGKANNILHMLMIVIIASANLRKKAKIKQR